MNMKVHLIKVGEYSGFHQHSRPNGHYLGHAIQLKRSTELSSNMVRNIRGHYETGSTIVFRYCAALGSLHGAPVVLFTHMDN